MIAHALDILRAEHQVNAERDIARVFHHVGEQLAEQRGAHRVDLLVALPDRERARDIAPGIGIQHPLDLAEHQRRHVLDAADQLLRMEVVVERGHPLGDVLGEVAYPLQVVGDAQRADHIAQVDRHRLAPGDGQHRFFLDLVLQRVDRSIAGHHALGQVGVPPDERGNRIRDQPLGEPTHLGDPLGQPLQVCVESLSQMLIRHRLSIPRRRRLSDDNTPIGCLIQQAMHGTSSGMFRVLTFGTVHR